MVAFCYSQPWSKHQIVATLQVAFMVATISRVALMAGTGAYFDRQVIILTLATVIPVAIGIFFGGKLLARISLKWLRVGVFAVGVPAGQPNSPPQTGCGGCGATGPGLLPLAVTGCVTLLVARRRRRTGRRSASCVGN